MSDQQTNVCRPADSFGAVEESRPDAGGRETMWSGASFSADNWPSETRANLLLVVLALAGAGSIYFLIPSDTLQTASAEQSLTELQVDSALLNLATLDASHGKAMEVVDTFYYQAKQRQIPLEEISRNPFVFKAPELPKPATQPAPKKQPAPLEKIKKAPQEMEEVKKLVLQSVLTGSRAPVAMISNNLLTEGQKISGWTLTKIDPRSVTLTWKDKTYILRMPN